MRRCSIKTTSGPFAMPKVRSQRLQLKNPGQVPRSPAQEKVEALQYHEWQINAEGLNRKSEVLEPTDDSSKLPSGQPSRSPAPHRLKNSSRRCQTNGGPPFGDSSAGARKLSRLHQDLLVSSTLPVQSGTPPSLPSGGAFPNSPTRRTVSKLLADIP
jgi:hypothetical protein